MRLEVGDNQGYVIIDDNTYHILDVFITIDEYHFDNKAISSYRKVGDKHFKL
jgi:hypothetical protein